MPEVHDLTSLTEDGEIYTYNRLMSSDTQHEVSPEQFDDIYTNVIERMDKIVTAWKKERKNRLNAGEHLSGYYNRIDKDKILVNNKANIDYIYREKGWLGLKVPTYKQLIKLFPEMEEDENLQVIEQDKTVVAPRKGRE
ncbi:hypothetical protein [Fructobacillus tropaeoli]|uniref:Putative O-methyltransferase n=1 Tax=Fructobacillus tropaeoli TaxID=709323 RepID=A0A3F3H3H1_9LACO|nr:hypothetical protein [Fructobacillus tropaeoli]GAP05014.1 putative O-methyltransferase [Fructobacillus tropaeoli]